MTPRPVHHHHIVRPLQKGLSEVLNELEFTLSRLPQSLRPNSTGWLKQYTYVSFEIHRSHCNMFDAPLLDRRSAGTRDKFWSPFLFGILSGVVLTAGLRLVGWNVCCISMHEATCLRCLAISVCSGYHPYNHCSHVCFPSDHRYRSKSPRGIMKPML